MELGDRRFRNLTTQTTTGGNPAQGESRGRPQALAAVTLFLLVGILFFGSASGLAKEKKSQTRTVQGVVFDPSENAIDGAAVELTDVQTGKVLDIYSENGGKYQYSDLRFDHDYTVKAMYKGLSSEVRKVSMLETRTPLTLNLTIPNPSK
jgi:hypothetical protein